MMIRQSKIRRLLDAISQFFNVLIFDGEANHSISGDSYRYNRKLLIKIINFIFSPWEKDHCKSAHEKDVMLACKLCKEALNINTKN